MKTQQDLVNLLKKKGISYHILGNKSGSLLVVPEKGARICSVSVDGENLLWSFKENIEKNSSVFGGQRSWLAPEGGKTGLFADDKGENWRCPAELDPGNYKPVWISTKGCSYKNIFSITSADKKKYDISLTRTMAIENNPHAVGWHSIKSLLLRFSHQLANEGSSTINKAVGLWSLLQVPCEVKGTVIIPLLFTNDRNYRDTYFRKVPEGCIKVADDIIYMQVLGGIDYKIGVGADQSAGCIASISPSRVDKDYVMIIKKFKVDNKGAYADRPAKEPETNGDPIQSYNSSDKGDAAFFELECHAPSIELKPQETQTFDIQIYFYKGPKKDIFKLARKEISHRFDAKHLFQEQE